mgnify:CR=1 FL=1
MELQIPSWIMEEREELNKDSKEINIFMKIFETNTP